MSAPRLCWVRLPDGTYSATPLSWIACTIKRAPSDLGGYEVRVVESRHGGATGALRPTLASAKTAAATWAADYASGRAA